MDPTLHDFTNIFLLYMYCSLYISFLLLFTVCPLWLYGMEYVYSPCAVVGPLYAHWIDDDREALSKVDPWHLRFLAKGLPKRGCLVRKLT